GRQAIEKEMQALFSENKGVRIEVINPSIRMVSPQVAIEEGTVRVIRPSEPPSDSTYLAVDVKEGADGSSIRFVKPTFPKRRHQVRSCRNWPGSSVIGLTTVPKRTTRPQ
ncbi:MAG: hypothetical protein ACLP9L_31605, partial [Thermoguttaceae bacterium]